MLLITFIITQPATHEIFSHSLTHGKVDIPRPLNFLISSKFSSKNDVILIKFNGTNYGWGFDNGALGKGDRFFDPWKTINDPDVPEITKESLREAIRNLNLTPSLKK